MRNKAKYVIAATALLSASTLAATPENGWWWNAAESGTGWNLEFQNGTMFASTFIYDDAGNPAWYSGSGQVNRNNMVTIELLRSSGGPCLGCEYSPVSTQGTGQLASFNFGGDGVATVTVAGQTQPIKRMSYSYGEGVNRLLGGWSIVEGSPGFPIYFGDKITLSATDNTDGVPGVTGSRTGASGKFLYISKRDIAGYEYLAILDSSTSYYQFYMFNLDGLNKISGLSALVEKSESSEEWASSLLSGTPFVGYRDNDGGQVNTKSLSLEPVEVDYEAINEQRLIQSAGGSNPNSSADPELARMLENMVR